MFGGGVILQLTVSFGFKPLPRLMNRG